MFIRRLRTKIALNIAILLFLAMLLIDLVTIVTVKRELIRSEAFKANVLLTSFESSMLSGVLPPQRSPDSSPSKMLAKMVDDPQVAGTLVLGRKGEQVFVHHLPDVSPVRLAQYTQAAMSSGKKELHYTGTAWGIFWETKHESDPFSTLNQERGDDRWDQHSSDAGKDVSGAAKFAKDFFYLPFYQYRHSHVYRHLPHFQTLPATPCQIGQARRRL